MTQKMPLAVVMGLSPTGLHVVRALGRAGVRVIGVADGPQAGAASRYCRKVINGSAAEKIDKICAAFPQGGEKPVLIATSDQDVDLIMENAEMLARHVRFQPSYADGLARQIMDKERFYQLCEAHGVAYPRLWSGPKAEIVGLGGQISFPCLIKPALIQLLKGRMGGQKGWIARDAEEYAQKVARIPSDAGTLLVQEIVEGPESNITLWCGHLSGQEVLSGFTARKLRQFPLGFGSASLVQSQAEPDSARIAETLLRTLGYQGTAAAEFKRGPDGQLKIIEINVRPSLWFSITDPAGRPTVLSAYRDLAGLPPLPEHAQIDGIRWRYWLKDLYSRLFYVLKPGFILPAPDIRATGPAQARTWAVFAWDDPMPALAELRNFARKALDRLKRGRR
jgi:predicted ATP-grasp superfamily ATP-dependent carboligase